MTGLDRDQDAFGRVLAEALAGKSPDEVIERDDGLVRVMPSSPTEYFAPYERWPAHQREAIDLARGRVLDIGCGGGRVALELQQRGHDVVAIDNSPGAVEVARRRGVRDARLLALADLEHALALGTFDTIIMLGANFGLFGSAQGARRLLRVLATIASCDARLLAETVDPYRTGSRALRDYQRQNRQRGRMTGQMRGRVRHRQIATPWFDYLYVSHGEMTELADGTGWRIDRFLPPDDAVYIGVLERDHGAR